MKVEMCPVCKGQKTVSKPPYIAGDVDSWTDNGSGPYPCPTCGAKGYLVIGGA